MITEGKYYWYGGPDFTEGEVLCTGSNPKSDVCRIVNSEGEDRYVYKHYLKKLQENEPTVQSGIKNDSGKRQWWYMDSFWPDLEEIVDVLEYGDSKYPAEDGSNWKRLDYPQRRFNDALLRHMKEHRVGNKIDPETGKSHLAHLITNALFLMYFDRQSKEDAFDTKTLEKIEEIVGKVRDSVHLSNSPYSNNEEVVHPYLDVIFDEIDYLKGNK